MFTNTKVGRARKRQLSTTKSSNSNEERTKRQHIITKYEICFICEKEAKEYLRHSSTMQIDTSLKEIALILNDSKLQAKLNGPDVVAQELKYHSDCYIFLQNKVRSL